MKKKTLPGELRDSGSVAGPSRGTVSSKGQITIPKRVRERFNLAPGTEVEFEMREDGALIHRRRLARHPVWEMIGSLKGSWPEGYPGDVDAYIDFVRGGPYPSGTHGARKRSGPGK